MLGDADPHSFINFMEIGRIVQILVFFYLKQLLAALPLVTPFLDQLLTFVST